MKNIIKMTRQIVLLLLAVSALLIIPACNDYPDAYKATSGVPTINYVRLPTAASSDSLLTHAFMGTTIAIMGSNLTSVNEIWFNNQKTILNTSMMNSTTIIVDVPTIIPSTVTNKIYFVTASGDTVKCDFSVDVPAPVINSMNCEYVAVGDTAVINGDYFLDDPNIPLQVIFPGNITATNIISIAKSQIKVKVPAGATISGPINVRSLYGNGRSSLWFRDNRGIILDFDTKVCSGAWRNGHLYNSDPAGVSGSYVGLTGSLANNSSWVEDNLAVELWGKAAGLPDQPLFTTNVATSVMKFEAYVVNPWKAGYLQMIFSNWTNAGNAIDSDPTVSRGLWRPWETNGTGVYQGSGWETVTIPLSDFKYVFTKDAAGNPVLLNTLALNPDNLGSLTFFVWGGGNDKLGAPCDVKICIDNIRVVPAN